MESYDDYIEDPIENIKQNGYWWERTFFQDDKIKDPFINIHKEDIEIILDRIEEIY